MRPTLRKIFVILAFALSFAVLHQKSVSASIPPCSTLRPFACYCGEDFYRCVSDPTRCGICP
jgi:hypothetical protein